MSKKILCIISRQRSDTLTYVYTVTLCNSSSNQSRSKRPSADIRCIVLLNKTFNQGRKRTLKIRLQVNATLRGVDRRLLHLMCRALLTIVSCKFSYFERKNVRYLPFTY